MSEEITVTRNDDESRYEIHVGDALGGFTEIRPDDDGNIRMPHTEVDPTFKGKGLGSRLVGDALADLARRGDTVVPLCPFVAKFARENEVSGLIVSWPEGTDATDAATPSEQAG